MKRVNTMANAAPANFPLIVGTTIGRKLAIKKIQDCIERGDNFYLYGERWSGKSHMYGYIANYLGAQNIPFQTFGSMPKIDDFRNTYYDILKEVKNDIYKPKDDSEVKGMLLINRLKNLVNKEYIQKGFPVYYLVIDQFVLDPTKLSLINILSSSFKLIFTCNNPIPVEAIKEFSCFYNLKTITLDPMPMEEQIELLNYLLDKHHLYLDNTERALYLTSLKRSSGFPGDIYKIVRDGYDLKVLCKYGTYTYNKLKNMLIENEFSKKSSGAPIVIAACCMLTFIGYQNASRFWWVLAPVFLGIYPVFLILKQYFSKRKFQMKRY